LGGHGQPKGIEVPPLMSGSLFVQKSLEPFLAPKSSMGISDQAQPYLMMGTVTEGRFKSGYAQR
jgi:hypothetical protein